MKLRYVRLSCSFFRSDVCRAGVRRNPTAKCRTGADRLAASIYTGPAMRTLRELSDGFGGRLTGSPAYNQAAEWAAAKFRSYGIQNVRLEPFTMANGWVRGTAQRAIAGARFRAPCIWSRWDGRPPRLPVAVKGEVVIVDDVSADNVKALGPTS